MFHVYGDARFERLAGITNGHLYHLRQHKTCRKVRGKVGKTRPVRVQIGERRKPVPHSQPGFLRVDSVHQGELDGIKGLYPINAVHEVTRFQCLFAVERISEHFLPPVLEQLIDAFPFAIHTFRSDNGSQYINRRVAADSGTDNFRMSAASSPCSRKKLHSRLPPPNAETGFPIVQLA